MSMKQWPHLLAGERKTKYKERKSGARKIKLGGAPAQNARLTEAVSFLHMHKHMFQAVMSNAIEKRHAYNGR